MREAFCDRYIFRTPLTERTKRGLAAISRGLAEHLDHHLAVRPLQAHLHALALELGLGQLVEEGRKRALVASHRHQPDIVARSPVARTESHRRIEVLRQLLVDGGGDASPKRD